MQEDSHLGWAACCERSSPLWELWKFHRECLGEHLIKPSSFFGDSDAVREKQRSVAASKKEHWDWKNMLCLRLKEQCKMNCRTSPQHLDTSGKNRKLFQKKHISLLKHLLTFFFQLQYRVSPRIVFPATIRSLSQPTAYKDGDERPTKTCFKERNALNINTCPRCFGSVPADKISWSVNHCLGGDCFFDPEALRVDHHVRRISLGADIACEGRPLAWDWRLGLSSASLYF
jgi:hypothetical protein